MSRLLFDIGGTSLRIATGTGDSLSNPVKLPTPHDPSEAVAMLALYAKEHMPDCEGASGGIAGVIEDGVVRSSPHLPSWDGFAFQASLADAIALPVHVQNDAELAGLGEATYGAGKGYGIVAYLGIGTGIGGSLIVDGKVARHASGFEPGHQILDVDSGATFEGLVSGHALEKHFGTPAHDLDRGIYDLLTPTLAAGIYNVLLTWSPDVLVLGGSLMNEENGYRIAAIEKALAERESVLPAFPPLVKAALGDDNGLYGALAFGS